MHEYLKAWPKDGIKSSCLVWIQLLCEERKLFKLAETRCESLQLVIIQTTQNLATADEKFMRNAT